MPYSRLQQTGDPALSDVVMMLLYVTTMLQAEKMQLTAA
jgi:hypothetical protein